MSTAFHITLILLLLHCHFGLSQKILQANTTKVKTTVPLITMTTMIKLSRFGVTMSWKDIEAFLKIEVWIYYTSSLLLPTNY